MSCSSASSPGINSGFDGILIKSSLGKMGATSALTTGDGPVHAEAAVCTATRGGTGSERAAGDGVQPLSFALLV